MSKAEPPPSPRSEATRAALVRAGLDLFGARGFEATSTREIAAAAKANIAMIAYHFGGKEGLRLACADAVVATIGRIFAGAEAAGDPASLTAVEARAVLARLVEGILDAIVVDSEARPLARFVLREMFEPSAAFERLYQAAIAPMHARACVIWARATGAAAESEETRLAVFALIAQIVYFRLARPAVLRRMDWREIGPGEAAAIKRQILGNLDAAIDLARRKVP